MSKPKTPQDFAIKAALETGFDDTNHGVVMYELFKKAMAQARREALEEAAEEAHRLCDCIETMSDKILALGEEKK